MTADQHPTPHVTAPELTAALAFLEAHVEAERQARHIPGLSIAVVHDQDVLWARGFGHADLASQTPATPRTVYRVGSITKLFTATMLMQLRAAGRLQLDDPIERYLPEFTIRSRFPDAQPPTFRQVVSHTAGLPTEPPLDHRQTKQFPTIEQVLSSLANTEMALPALTERHYSNLGIACMGHALERITRQPYADYVTEHVLRPLGMHASAYERTPDLDAHLAVGYDPAAPDAAGPPEVASHPHRRALSPGGQLYSTVEDLARFISLQFRQGPADGASQVLGGATLREMHAPVFMDRDGRGGGIGWMLGRLDDHPTIGHGGGTEGFTSNLLIVPEAKLGAIVLTNTITAPAEFTMAALRLLLPVLRRVLDRARGPAASFPDEWQRYLGHYRSAGAHLEIVARDGQLAALPLPHAPQPLATLVPLEPHRFRSQGGPFHGELARFEVDGDGTVRGLRLGNTLLRRE